MFFKVRLLHRIIALIIVTVHLGGCSGYKWTTGYDKTKELPSDQKVLLVEKAEQRHIYEFNEVQMSTMGFVGVIDPNNELKSIPREKEVIVIYTDVVTTILEQNETLKVMIPHESITKTKKLEYDKDTKIGRTLSLILIPVFIFIVVASEIAPDPMTY